MTEQAPWYREVNGEKEIFRHAWEQHLPLLLKGPTGCGKSRFVEAMAFELKRPLITVACHEDTSATDLLGRYLVEGGDTVWKDGPLTRAVRTGAILYLDEIAEAREDVVVVLHPLTDHRREVYIDKVNEQIKAPKEFMLVGSFNPGYQRRIKELKPSTRQRFIALDFDYPEAAVEREIVQAEAGVSASVAAKLVDLGRRIRTLEELGLTETVSTRLLVYAGRAMAAGLPARRSCEVAIASPLTDDPEIVQSIRDIVALVF